MISAKPTELEKVSFIDMQILGLLVKTLAADAKYPVFNRDKLTMPIQMQLSQKQKTFSQCFADLLKSRLNVKYFERKDARHRFCIF